ncbi:trafficking protein particle complex subunit 8-like isoform X1 [Saccostrea echinata]|uniref:trafficking protein particle complex subunit 8-like isoform X1 n=1 Tax=Saccostrea echinata TaxID=191078 RepID=UPI002A8172EA|nr:trafficking protein particle complex subunit 8-like isoform X1 [Saccostrea echinata]
MAQCKQTAQEFIQNTFSPAVAVLCSPDAEVLCQKNNLTFVELVQPFCRLTTEVHIRDPNNVPHTIKNLKITMRDMNMQLPQAVMARKMLNDVVASTQPQLGEGSRGNVVTFGSYDLQLSASTPWFEAYRDMFLKVLPPSDHEFLSHCLCCIFVVSSGHSDPINAFNTLSSNQYQQQTQYPTKMPRWFCPGILKYYVLLHDVVEGEDAKADAVYQSMKSSFGGQNCHLLHINSRSLHTAETMHTDLPDPWSQFLNKNNSEANSKKRNKARYFIAWEGAEYDSASNSVVDDAFPSKLSEGTTDSPLSGPIMSNSSLVDMSPDSGEGTASSGSLTSETFDHPLSEPSQDLNHVDSPLSPDKTYEPELNHTSFKGKLGDRKQGGHGICLTTSDQDRIKIFMHELCVRALIPWAERQMKILNEQHASRKGISKSLFSATKRWFGGNKPTGQVAANQNTTVVYSSDAPELQMRRLGDIAFLFQMYDFAYNTYHAAKRDFNNDHAWLHYAGALEMACISLFMSGNPREQKYPFHYMESAITTYLQSCKNPLYATRATLVSTEALKSRKMYNEAALQFIKLTSEDSDLRSALLLEQAAHCYINMEIPKVRKYAFHMILSGHRYSKSGQRKHALRSYSQALQVYKGKNWSLAEDHINFTLGRQSLNLKQLDNATAAFKHLLTENSKQIPSQQNAFLREYLFVYKQLLSLEMSSYGGVHSNTLPELPIPMLDNNATKVIVGHKPQHNQDKPGHIGYDYTESNHPRWQALEEALVSFANNGILPVTHRPTIQCFTNKTDNRFNPVAYVGEPVTVELYLVNPLKVVLVLTEVTLLWSFLPSIPGQDKPQLITNEVFSSVKNTLANEIIHTQVIDEIVLPGSERSPVQFTLTPHQTGELRIVGICYNLSSSLTDDRNIKPSPANTVYVRGKQRLDVQGPRLNNTKEEKSSKVYGPDRRLDLVIQPEMPQLQVSFCNFPKSLLCGEVHAVMLQFTNIGTSPLHKLKLASSTPEFITLGDHGELPKFPCVYQTKNEVPSEETKCYCNTKDKVCNVMDIPLPNRTLQPKSTVSVPAWVRGNDIGGVHDVHFMFYYEPVTKSPRARHRLQRHTAVINTLESLSVRSVAHRANSVHQSSSSQASCILSCEMENISQVQANRAYVKEIQVNQVSCASDLWSIQYLSSQDKPEIIIGCRETMHLCLKATKSANNLDSMLGKESVIFSDVSFSDQQISSATTPCADFFLRSRSQSDSESSAPTETVSKSREKDFRDLNCAIQLGMTLIILWKACVISEDGELQIKVGQHHVIIKKIDTIFTSYPFFIIPTEKPPIRFTRSRDEQENIRPESEVTTQLVDINFNHQAQVPHNFQNNRIAIVPVTLLLRNCTKASVEILVDTSKSPDRLNNRPEEKYVVPEVQHLTSFSWVSQTLTKLSLDPSQQRTVHMTACFSKPGIYNVNRLAVFVTHNKDTPEMVLQRHAAPSVIVIQDVSSE